jgi:hypothetical protein
MKPKSSWWRWSDDGFYEMQDDKLEWMLDNKMTKISWWWNKTLSLSLSLALGEGDSAFIKDPCLVVLKNQSRALHVG